jgi:hypothetical protein
MEQKKKEKNTEKMKEVEGASKSAKTAVPQKTKHSNGEEFDVPDKRMVHLRHSGRGAAMTSSAGRSPSHAVACANCYQPSIKHSLKLGS